MRPHWPQSIILRGFLLLRSTLVYVCDYRHVVIGMSFYNFVVYKNIDELLQPYPVGAEGTIPTLRSRWPFCRSKGSHCPWFSWYLTSIPCFSSNFHNTLHTSTFHLVHNLSAYHHHLFSYHNSTTVTKIRFKHQQMIVAGKACQRNFKYDKCHQNLFSNIWISAYRSYTYWCCLALWDGMEVAVRIKIDGLGLKEFF